MPTIYGVTLPEVQSAHLFETRLKILIETKNATGQLWRDVRDLCILREYVRAIPHCTIDIEVAGVEGEVAAGFGLFGLTLVSLSNDQLSRPEALVALAKEIGADILVPTTTDSVQNPAEKDLDCPLTVLNIEDAKREAEVFVAGFEIPWSFEMMVWNFPWQAFHPTCDPEARKASALFVNYGNQLGLSDSDFELMRSLLLNRMANLCYERKKLLFYIRQRRQALRRGLKRQRYVMEAGLLLTQYYVDLWAGLDQLARLYSSLFGIRKSKHDRLAVNWSNKAFVRKVLQNVPDLKRIVLTLDFLRWRNRIKTIRHYIVHEGTVVLRPLVAGECLRMTEQDLEVAVESSREWAEYRTYVPAGQHDKLKQFLRFKFWHEQLVSDLDDLCVVPKGRKQLSFYPLRTVDSDFRLYCRFILSAVEFAVDQRLSKAGQPM